MLTHHAKLSDNGDIALMEKIMAKFTRFKYRDKDGQTKVFTGDVVEVFNFAHELSPNTGKTIHRAFTPECFEQRFGISELESSDISHLFQISKTGNIVQSINPDGSYSFAPEDKAPLSYKASMNFLQWHLDIVDIEIFRV